MSVSFDTLVTAVYCIVDDWLIQDRRDHPRSRFGTPPAMSEAEVITLAVIGHRIDPSERHVLAVIADRDPTLFPHLLSQHAFNDRVRSLEPVMARLLVALGTMLGRETSAYELADVVMVPVVRRCRAGRLHGLRTLVSGGKGGSERTWIEGCSLLLATTAEGAITGYVLGSARTEGRWLLDALVQWRSSPTSTPWVPADIPIARTPKGPDLPIIGHHTAGIGAASGRYLVDNGFTGAHWHHHWASLGATVVLDGGIRASTAERKAHHGKRQRIETVNGTLKRMLHLAYPGATSIAGLQARITAKCCMHNLGMLINRLLGRDDLALGTLMRI